MNRRLQRAFRTIGTILLTAVVFLAPRSWGSSAVLWVMGLYWLAIGLIALIVHVIYVVRHRRDPVPPRLFSWPREPLLGPLGSWELVRLARRGQGHRARLLVLYILFLAFVLTAILWF